MSEQVNGNYRVRNAHIRPLYEQAMQLLTAFQYYSIDHIPRSLNSEADDLANQALNKLQKP
jgi:ribonuclease HI